MTASSICAACELPLKPTQSACRCGYSNAARDYVRPTASEAYFLERRLATRSVKP